tara:strand:- start:374 stop:577 length:204 start_codon:yes stop_codon:yes gene_type:complete
MKDTYTLVYAPDKSESKASHQVYEVTTHPAQSEKLYNKGINVGFITNVVNRREGIRAFRFDRIVSFS